MRRSGVIERRRASAFLDTQPSVLRHFRYLQDGARGGGIPGPMRLGSSNMKVPDSRDPVARQRTQCQLIGLRMPDGHRD